MRWVLPDYLRDELPPAAEHLERLRRELRLPVVDPLAAIGDLLPIVQAYLDACAARSPGGTP